jgi:uncharacterized membrane protein YsdA (DUF1294 family)
MNPLLLYGAWLFAASVLTFIFYGLDKRKAASDAWRIPERTLHLLSLVGGFAGGWAGRTVFRHKTQKPIFLIILIAATLIHCGVFYLLWKK